MWGIVTAVVKGLAEGLVTWWQVWTRDRYLVQETEARLKLERAEDELRDERAIREQSSQIRDAPGPRLPDL